MAAEQLTTQPEMGQPGAIPAASVPPVVMTKLRVPRRRTSLLSRRRLVDFIHAHLDRKLILISAPAGYGKTTLLTDLAHDTDLPVCWYTLDTFDRDLRVFLEHFIAAIALRFTAFGAQSLALLRSTPDPSHDLYPLVATLVKEIYDTIPEYFILVLDDYHAVEVQERISEFLDLFANYVDENCHLIIASRTLPALPNLSLLLARHQVAGLSVDELRFVPQEIRALAQQNYNLTLAPERAEELAERTEGWITGLLLTVAPGWEEAQGRGALHRHVNVDLYDYLSRQVLEQQPLPLRDFLLASSVLDELDPELCATVLGMDRPADLMDQLRARNLFVIEFEGSADTLRYHDLFRDFLQSTLRRQDNAHFMELTRRAADVYVARSQWERAVSRYLALKDYERVAEIIEQVDAHMYATGRWDTLADWIDALPGVVLATKPRCLIYRGKIYMERGEHTLALTCYDQAQGASASMGDELGTAHALVHKSHALRFQGGYTEALAHCHEALSLANGSTVLAKSIQASAHRNAALCHLRLGQLEDGLGALQQSLRLAQELDIPYDIGMTHHDLGLAYELRGDLDGAADHYQSALQQWGHLGNLGAWANTLNSLGVIHYLRGDYDQARQFLSEALTKVRQVNNLRVEALIWASLGDLDRDLGAYDLAQQAYDEGLQAATRSGEGFVVTYALDGLGNILRMQGDLVQARKRLREALDHAKRHASTYEIGLCRNSLGILDLEERRLSAAYKHLNRAIRLFRAGGYKREWARACLYRAQLHFLKGELEKAQAGLKRTLALAKQLGFDQFLVVDGQRLQPLLQYAARQLSKDSAVARLLKRIRTYQAQSVKQAEPAAMTEPGLPLRIYALGRPRVELKGQPVQWATGQSRDFFFCLLQHPQGLRKEEIGAIFWPDHPPHKLDNIFRSTLYRLRRALFRESIVLESGLYCFNWQCDYWFDVQVFEGLMTQAQAAIQAGSKIRLLQEACELYGGDYLDGNDADWCRVDRERLRERYLGALETLATLHTDRGELQSALALYQSILSRDPYRESAYRGQMVCYYRLGDRAAAIRQYQTCAALLRDELGTSPAPETSQLFLEIAG